jgi:CheY-specific phosphatase CheX
MISFGANNTTRKLVALIPRTIPVYYKQLRNSVEIAPCAIIVHVITGFTDGHVRRNGSVIDISPPNFVLGGFLDHHSLFFRRAASGSP